MFLRDLNIYDPASECPRNLESALLLWVCKIYQLMCVRLAAEMKDHVPTSKPNYLEGPCRLEEVIKLHYLLVALVEFYFPNIMQSYFPAGRHLNMELRLRLLSVRE